MFTSELVISYSITDETSDVTYEQLSNALHRMGIINGIEIANTLYPNISFLNDYLAVTVLKDESGKYYTSFLLEKILKKSFAKQFLRRSLMSYARTERCLSRSDFCASPSVCVYSLHIVYNAYYS